MTLPRPEPGLVIRYSYLWLSEHREGREEGIKDRPCAVVLALVNADGDTRVTVLPITHSPPADASIAIEVPPDTKKRLGLDTDRSWIEGANLFGKLTISLPKITARKMPHSSRVRPSRRSSMAASAIRSSLPAVASRSIF